MTGKEEGDLDFGNDILDIGAEVDGYEEIGYLLTYDALSAWSEFSD